MVRFKAIFGGILLCVALCCLSVSFLSVGSFRNLNFPSIHRYETSQHRKVETASKNGDSIPQDVQKRVKLVQQQCLKTHAQGRVVEVYTHSPSKTAYCVVPKVGCTFWRRMFLFANNATRPAKSPWETSRYNVHTKYFKDSGVNRWNISRTKTTHDYTRFMFVRHPYIRLWSAYVDKIFLPNYWIEFGKKIIRSVRKIGNTSSTEDMRNYKQALRCGNDVTFPEFVTFSLKENEFHWEPISSRCDPCGFRPNYIGTMETFSRDSLYLLSKMNLQKYLENTSHKYLKEKELAAWIPYNLNFPMPQECLNKSEVALKLWKAMKINGYIPDDADLPSSVLNSTKGSGSSAKKMIDAALRLYRKATAENFDLKGQKRRYFLNAWQSLTLSTRQKLFKKYERDMNYFGFTDDNF